MLKLYGGNQSISAVQSGPSTSLDYYADWTDINASKVVDSGVNQGNIASSSTTSLVPGPATNNYTRQVNFISFVNNDAVNAAIMQVRNKVSSGTFNLTSPVTLLPGWALRYQAGVGWQVFDSNGIPVESGSASSVISLVFPFTYADTTPELVGTLPPGKLVYSVEIVISTVYNGTTPTLTVGDASNYSSLMSAAENDATTLGSYTSTPSSSFSSVTPIYLSQSTGSSTAGAGTLIVRYQA